MGDINIKKIERLRLEIQLLEGLTMVGIVGIGLSVYQHKEAVVYYLVVALLLLYVLKLYAHARLRKKEFLSNIVEQRTMELRFQRDKIQAESQKLSEALSALAEAQDELVRKEKLASVGQLTKGLVDRILNPLNYINNFASLSVTLSGELKTNMEEDATLGNQKNFNDSQELIGMLCSNLDKISKHGQSTVRIVKAMEELLKEYTGNPVPVEVNELCKVSMDVFRKTAGDLIEDTPIILTFIPLTHPLTMMLQIEQMNKVLSHLLDNCLYAVIKKASAPHYTPEISLTLRADSEQLILVIRDNGTGMDETVRQKAFSPFFTTKTTAEAAGTGLYLSREVILNHKGNIRIASEKDQFTEVIIQLPIHL